MSLTKGLDINTNQSIMLLVLESGIERMHPFGDQSDFPSSRLYGWFLNTVGFKKQYVKAV